MRETGVFAMIGPIMRGPSSSHTAGAARLGRVARTLLGEPARWAEIELHGSFAQTGKGHGTDRALVGGLLGLSEDNPGITTAFELAGEQGFTYTFRNVDLGPDMHPNTARIFVEGVGGRRVEVLGASIGGGAVLIKELNGLPLELSGTYPALVTVHRDQPGVIARVTDQLALHQINVAYLRVSRQKKGDVALLVAETDQEVPAALVDAVLAAPGVERVVRLDAF